MSAVGGLPTDEQIADAVLHLLPDPVAVLGPGAEVLWANRAAEQRFGYALEDVRGQSLAHLAHPDDLDTALMSLSSVASKEVGTLVEIRIRDATGSYAWFEVRGAGWPDAPVPGSIVLVLRDSTDRHRWELAAGDTEVLGAILDATPTITMLLGADGTIRSANRALTRLLHRDLEGTLGRSLLDLVPTDDRERVAAELADLADSGRTHQLEIRLLAADGTEMPMSLTIVDLTDDAAVQGLVATASDISALVAVRNELRHLATHDDLTGLPNRTRLRLHLDDILDHRRPDHAVLFADVDGLKPVNDRYGHQAGDAVLVEVATRLRRAMREEDFVARVGGDEFVAVVPTTDPAVLRDLQARLHRALEAPIELPDGTPVTLSMSVGVATTRPGLSAEEVLAAADEAMYAAKRERTAGL